MGASDIVRLRNERACSRCGHARIEALVSSIPILCASCHAAQRGVSTIERHHIAGRSNLDWTIPVDVNDHRLLSALQRRWPTSTLRNPDDDDRIRVSGLLRGVADFLTLLALYVEASI